MNYLRLESDGMKFSEAKQRNDYKFTLNEIENLIEDIRSNCMKNLYENGDGYRGAAVLEIGYVDIEVNIYTEEQLARFDYQIGNKTPIINYFTCLKHGDSKNDWASDSYLDYNLNVDWNADNWREQLERDMFIALDMYVNANGYSYDHAN